MSHCPAQVGAWIYDRDPLTPLQWEEALGRLKARLSRGEDVFGPLIHKYLLSNTHRWAPLWFSRMLALFLA